MIEQLLFELRKRKVRVGLQEAVGLAHALTAGLHESSLGGFYNVARALCVHTEGDLDAFDEAFAACFRGAAAGVHQITAAIEEWLRDPKLSADRPPEELEGLRRMSLDELRRAFTERSREQSERSQRHDGGNRWIGTGGASPFGVGGAHPTGVRAGPQGAGRSAMAVADARAYRPYRSDLVLDVRRIEVALRKLRALTREEGTRELDVDATIDATARSGGELEVVTRPPRRSNVRVILLMDVGGSMDPHAEVVEQLFSAAKRASTFRELRTYYFHNCIYGRVYETAGFRDPTPVHDLLQRVTCDHKLVVVGDAAMHPAELLGGGEWSASRADSAVEAMAGIRWMQLLADHFHKSAWLNPDSAEPLEGWNGGAGDAPKPVEFVK